MNIMASSGLSINSVVITIIAIAIGIVMIGSLLAPTAVNVMGVTANLRKRQDFMEGRLILSVLLLFVAILGTCYRCGQFQYTK